MKFLTQLVACVLFAFLLSAPARSDQLMIVRSSQDFEDAMSTLQAAIKNHGYQLTKIQRVDVGLEAKGYKTDKYRVVFYGKPDEIARLTEKHPEIIPYLPLNIAIFSELNNTILTSLRPATFKEFFQAPELQPIFDQWENDLVKILDEVRETK